jgi:hypothetical protein
VTKCDTETQNKHILLEKKGVDRLIQCRVATDLQFVTNAVSVRRNEGKHNKISYTVSMLYMEICYGDWLTWLWRLVTGSRKPMASFSLSLKVFELGNGPSQTERAILSFFYFFFFSKSGPSIDEMSPSNTRESNLFHSVHWFQFYSCPEALSHFTSYLGIP